MIFKTPAVKHGDERTVVKFAFWPKVLGRGSFGNPVRVRDGGTVWLETYESLQRFYSDGYWTGWEEVARYKRGTQETTK